MNRPVPDDLIFLNSFIHITYEMDSTVNKTNSAIIINGNRAGFLSLSNIILFYANDLEGKIHLHQLPFVKSASDLTIQISEEATSISGDIAAIGGNGFIWKLTERNVDHISASIHSLGHINNELHLDNGKITDDISVYCVVDADAP